MRKCLRFYREPGFWAIEAGLLAAWVHRVEPSDYFGSGGWYAALQLGRWTWHEFWPTGGAKGCEVA